MAGDLDITEWAVFIESDSDQEGPGADGRSPRPDRGPDAPRAIHRYGRIAIMAAPPDAGPPPAGGPALGGPDQLDDVERLGLAALQLRSSSEYARTKDDRPRSGEEWDMPDCTTVVPVPEGRAPQADAGAQAAAPTSAYLEGSVAVGVIIVEGPTAALQFSVEERTKVVAEVQNGLGFYPGANPSGGISFTYDVQVVRIETQPDPADPDLEGLWRNPTMAALGYAADFSGVDAYVEDIRTRFGTRWTYCAYFTKYPVAHFAYASIGGPRVVMDYANDGWGPDNIDRVFAHETGHIFGCPDEYATSGCDCGGSWGRFGVPNGNDIENSKK